MVEATCEIRVRYGETDQMRVAYYAHYLNWFEAGRSNLLRKSGLSYRDLESQGVFLPVIEAHCRYLKPAHYDDLLRILTKVSQAKRTCLLFEYKVRRIGIQGSPIKRDGPCKAVEEDKEDELLATGNTVHAAVNQRGKPMRLPDQLTRLVL